MATGSIPGVVLAGGRATRMGGGDKTLRGLAGRPLLGWITARLAPQCGPLAINANGDPTRFHAFGLPVIADAAPDSGPLAGVLAAMDWCSAVDPAAECVLTVPGDCPFLPANLVARLSGARSAGGKAIAMAASQSRRHPVVALWSLGLRQDLRQAVLHDGVRRIGEWAAGRGAEVVQWDAVPVDPFFNANTPEDLAEAGRLAAAQGLA